MDTILNHYLCRTDRSQIMFQKWLIEEDNLAKLIQYLLASDLAQWDQHLVSNLLMLISEDIVMFMHQPLDMILVKLVESIIRNKWDISQYILTCQLTYVLLQDWIEENMHNPVDESKFIRLKAACDTKVKLQNFINNSLNNSSNNGILILQNAMGISIDTKKRKNESMDINESKIALLSYDYLEDPKVEEEKLNIIFASLKRTSLWIRPINDKLDQPSADVTKQLANEDTQQQLNFDKYHEIKTQIFKLNKQLKSSTSSNSLTKQLKAVASTIVTELDYLGASNIAFIDQVYALYCMSCWKAHDDLLLAICESLLISDHIRGIAIALAIVGILLPHARLLTTPATRTLIRAVEIILNKRPELCVYGLLARCILVLDRSAQVNTHKPTTSTTVSALASVPLKLETNVAVKKVATSSPGSIQFELLQRCTRQLLKPDQIGVLVETIVTPLDELTEADAANVSSGIRELVNTIESMDSLLCLHVTSTTAEPISYVEFVRYNETDRRNNILHILWDNESLKALQSILSATRPKLKAIAISAIISNLYHAVATPGTTNLVDTISLPSLLNTLLTIYGTHFNHDSIRNDTRNMLIKCTNSKIIVKNCLNLLDTIEKNKPTTNQI